ncbi:MAG: hypothetical protein KKH22_06575 [Proteobacteria bacterium]|nr:hypothetical protein [Pseudomonadota bacterium]
MSAFQDQMAKDLAAIHGEQGEPVIYSRGADSVVVPAVFRGLTVDDLVSEHVMADAVVCEILEAEIHAAPFNRQPLRGDVIARTLPAGADGSPRVQSLEVASQPVRDESGVWRLTCQQNIRVTP